MAEEEWIGRERSVHAFLAVSSMDPLVLINLIHHIILQVFNSFE